MTARLYCSDDDDLSSDESAEEICMMNWIRICQVICIISVVLSVCDFQTNFMGSAMFGATQLIPI